ncbi:hypothetical protein [Halobacillus salinus]|uniref:hypothetical protein n=1 Tax=Halobacillus salinus TaxID=192814 RepID=UPI0009A5B35B|nr:hypothetical protein [Halobacillus salinus]
MDKQGTNPIFKVLLTIILFAVIVFIMIKGISIVKLNSVKQEVLNQNSEITAVEKINSVGQWGELQTSYVLEVRKGSSTLYRVWADEEGEIKDAEIISGD